MKRIVILMTFFVCVFVLNLSAQSLRPLGLTIETNANFDNAEWRWTPVINFRLVGPVEENSKIIADFTFPNGSPFVTLTCDAPRLDAGANTKPGACGLNSSHVDFKKATNQIGIFGFTVKINTKVIYTGKFKVGKNLYNFYNEPEKNKQFYYFVDNDFRLAYSYLDKSTDEIYCELWLKNKIMNIAEVDGYLYLNGKQIDEASPSFPLNLHAKENAKESYSLVVLRFSASEQPAGEYEIKLKRSGEFVRSVKFTVGADKKMVVTNIGRDLVGGNAILAPVQILGTSDGIFDKSSWKNGIFGNPISGIQ